MSSEKTTTGQENAGAKVSISENRIYFPYVIEGLQDKTLFQAMTDLNDDMLVFITDLDTGASVWSANIKEFYDYPDDYLERATELGKERIHPDDAAEYAADIGEIFAGKKFRHSHQWRVADSKGEYAWIQCNGVVKMDKESGKRFFIGHIFRLDRSSLYDPLTKLPNQFQFTKLANQVISAAAQNGTLSFSVVYFDICNFMSTNIEKGFEYGDDILKILTRILETSFHGDLVCRLNSDHFVVLTKQKNIMRTIAEVQDEFRYQVLENGLTLKAGVYTLDSAEVDLGAAEDYAKTAVDSIKNTDENIAFYDATLEKKLRLDKYICSHVDEAIEKGWIKVYYQPVVRAITGAICGFEALVRWIDPVYGFLSPADVIPVLEKERLIHKVDQHVIKEVCRLLRSSLDAGKDTVPISVNLSRMDFLKCDIAAYIEGGTKEFAVARELLNLEVTESVMMSDPKSMKRSIQELRSLGYQVWMDDFGSGYSSLNLLKNFSFDEIKLDMEFMSDFNEASKQIVKSLIAMAKKLGIPTLVEGVESNEQYEFLKSIGCDKIQGYLIGRPVPMEEWVASQQSHAREIEPLEIKNYYQALETLDFMTDRSFSVIEHNGNRCDILFANDAFKKEWNSLGLVKPQENEPLSRITTSGLWQKLQELLYELAADHEERRVDYNVDAHRIVRIKTRNISGHEGRMLCTLELINISKRIFQNGGLNDEVVQQGTAQQFPVMTHEEYFVAIQQLSKIYDLVRTVDHSKHRVVRFHEDGSTTLEAEHYCYEAWNKKEHCGNCSSAKAYTNRSRVEKFEFKEDQIYHVTSQYIEVDGVPYVLEIVEKSADDSLEEVLPAAELHKRVKDFNTVVYTDSLTQVRNRRFYDDQLSTLEVDAVAMIDLDGFKEVNDTYGHIYGDKVLNEVAQTIQNSIPLGSNMVRYGGDEFVMVSQLIDEKKLKDSLEKIRRNVEQLNLSHSGKGTVTISIGAVLHHDKASNLLELADSEMYRAKKAKNSISVKVL